MQTRSAFSRLAAALTAAMLLLCHSAAWAQGSVSTNKTNYAPYEPTTVIWSGRVGE